MTDSNNLVELLKLFNRKERYWCIQNLIKDPNILNKELLEECGIPNDAKPEEIYWAMDYHINWIYAVLYLMWFMREKKYSIEDLKKYFKNKKTRLEIDYNQVADSCIKHEDINGETIQDENGDRGIFLRNQEDFDILLAYKNQLILIEAKFDSGFDKKQYEKKRRHYKNFEKYVNDQKLGIEVKFILYSPKDRAPSFKNEEDGYMIMKECNEEFLNVCDLKTEANNFSEKPKIKLIKIQKKKKK